MVVIVAFVVITDEADIHTKEENKDEALHATYEQLQEVEGENEARAVEEVFTTEDVSEETDGEGEGANEDGYNFDEAYYQEDKREEKIHTAADFFSVGLVTKEVKEDDFQASVAEADDEPSRHGHDGEGDSTVPIRIGGTDKGVSDVEDAFRIVVTHTKATNAWEEARPVVQYYIEEKAENKGEGGSEGLFTNNGGHEVTQGTDGAFDDGLAAAGDELGRAYHEADAENNSEGDPPAGNDAIRDGKPTDVKQHVGTWGHTCAVHG